MIKRRQFIKNAAAAGLASQFLPRMSFAATPGAGDRKFILIILRGAMDGLGAVPAYSDPAYARQRGQIALEQSQTLKLDGLFALHPSLNNLHSIYRAGQANIIHAVASPYRARSHFDGQDVLETGQDKAFADSSGWLGRLLSTQSEKGIALSHGLPLILRGSDNGTSWAPSRLPGVDDDLIRRLEMLYENDPMLNHSLEQAVMTNDIAAASMMGGKKRGFRQSITLSAGHAVKFLKADDHVNIAVLESYGWDTHARQGTTKGPLTNGLKDLDNGLGLIKKELGPLWQKTAVAVVTEFGRTVWANGNVGTDHGTGGVAFLTGGAVQGGRIITDWPGLRTQDLYQERDLYPTTDIRSLFKGIIRDHLMIKPDVVEDKIFQNSGTVKALGGLFKT